MIRSILASTATAAVMLGGPVPDAAAALPAGAAVAIRAGAPADRGAVAAGGVVAAPDVAPASGVAATAARPSTDLTLLYMAEAGYATAVTLRCNPPGGAHPKPAAACRTLRAVRGRPARIKPSHTMCMMIYAPITAQITGKWRGSKINWSKTYGNTCEMTRATGVLFRF